MASTSAPRGPASPVVRPISWSGALQTLLMMGAFVAAGHFLLGRPFGVMAGAAAYLAYRAIFVRAILCREHLEGLAALRDGEVKRAADCFAASERTWLRRRVLDRWRALLLGSSSPHDYLTLARYNRAFCLARLRRRDEALEILDALLVEDRDNALAFTLRELLLPPEEPEKPTDDD